MIKKFMQVLLAAGAFALFGAVSAQAVDYTITKSGTTYTVNRTTVPTASSSSTSIQTVIEWIRSNATSSNPAVITFQGSGGNALDIEANGITFNNTGGTWGAVTLRGSVTGSPANTGVISVTTTVSVTCFGEITSTGGHGISFSSTGTLTIGNGAIIKTSSYDAIYFSSQSPGTVNINEGAIVQGNRYAVYVQNSGTLNISGSATSPSITSIMSSAAAIIISGTGKANISGGKVSTTYVRAIWLNGAGELTVSDNAVVESTGATASSGTIYNGAGGIVNIFGGTVRNTNASGNAVYLASTTGSVILGNDPTVTGRIATPEGRLSVKTTAGNTFAPGTGKIYTVYTTTSPIALGSTIAVTGGGSPSRLANFASANAGYKPGVSGSNLVFVRDSDFNYRVFGSGTSFTATSNGGAYTVISGVPIQNAIDAIKADVSGNNCQITFYAAATGTAQLDIGTGNIHFNRSAAVSNWGNLITLHGSVKSSDTGNSGRGTVMASNGANITSDAVIVNSEENGQAIYFNSTGELRITGGTVTAGLQTGSSRAIVNATTGKVYISGSTTLVSSPSIAILNDSTGEINVSGGRVESTNPNGGTGINSIKGGTVNVSGGTVWAAIQYAITSGNTVNGGACTISSGTVESAGTLYAAVYVTATSPLTVSGGTVKSGSKVAIFNYGTTTVTGTAVVTAALANETSGAIYNSSDGNHYGTLYIYGGTVQNTAAGGNAVYVEGYYPSAVGTVTLGNDPVITGNITGPAGSIIAKTAAPNAFAPGSRNYTVNLTNPASNAIAVKDGATPVNHIARFATANSDYSLRTSGANIVLMANRTVTVAAGGGISVAPGTAVDGDAYTGTVNATANHIRPLSVTATMGGVSFGNFTYNSTTGAFTVNAGVVTGNIIITAVRAPYTVTPPSNTSITLTTAAHGAPYTGTINAAPTFGRPTTITSVMVGSATLSPSNYSYAPSTGVFTIANGANVTGNIVITATAPSLYPPVAHWRLDASSGNTRMKHYSASGVWTQWDLAVNVTSGNVMIRAGVSGLNNAAPSGSPIHLPLGDPIYNADATPVQVPLVEIQDSSLSNNSAFGGSATGSIAQRIGSMTLPGTGFQKIGADAFAYFRNITSLSPRLPASVNHIGDGAFYCWNIFNQDFTVPGSVEEIGSGALAHWNAFDSKFTLEEGVKKFTDKYNGAVNWWSNFNQDITLPSTFEGGLCIIGWTKFDKPFVVPEGVNWIILGRWDEFNQAFVVPESATFVWLYDWLKFDSELTFAGENASEIHLERFHSFNRDFTIPPSVETLGCCNYWNAYDKILTIPATVTQMYEWTFACEDVYGPKYYFFEGRPILQGMYGNIFEDEEWEYYEPPKVPHPDTTAFIDRTKVALWPSSSIVSGDIINGTGKLYTQPLRVTEQLVTLDAATNGGSVGVPSVLVSNTIWVAANGGTEDYSGVPDASRTGYAFLGWNTQADGLGDWLDAATVTSDITVYACFKKLFTVSFDANLIDASGYAVESIIGSVDVKDGNLEDAIALAGFGDSFMNGLDWTLYDAEANTGYMFLGWMATGGVFGSDEPTHANNPSIIGDTTAYAMWLNLFAGMDYGDTVFGSLIAPIDPEDFFDGQDVVLELTPKGGGSPVTYLGTLEYKGPDPENFRGPYDMVITNGPVAWGDYWITKVGTGGGVMELPPGVMPFEVVKMVTIKWDGNFFAETNNYVHIETFKAGTWPMWSLPDMSSLDWESYGASAPNTVPPYVFLRWAPEKTLDVMNPLDEYIYYARWYKLETELAPEDREIGSYVNGYEEGIGDGMTVFIVTLTKWEHEAYGMYAVPTTNWGKLEYRGPLGFDDGNGPYAIVLDNPVPPGEYWVVGSGFEYEDKTTDSMEVPPGYMGLSVPARVSFDANFFAQPNVFSNVLVKLDQGYGYGTVTSPDSSYMMTLPWVVGGVPVANPGYHFERWNIKSDDADSGASFWGTVYEGCTIYASWFRLEEKIEVSELTVGSVIGGYHWRCYEGQEYEFVLVPQGGGAPITNRVESVCAFGALDDHNGPYDLKLKAPLPPGDYWIIGATPDPDGNDSDEPPDAITFPPGVFPLEVYENTVDISFDVNDGDRGVILSTNATFNTEYGLYFPSPAPTWTASSEGYTFVDWVRPTYTIPSESMGPGTVVPGRRIAATDLLGTLSSHTLFAMWLSVKSEFDASDPNPEIGSIIPGGPMPGVTNGAPIVIEIQLEGGGTTNMTGHLVGPEPDDGNGPYTIILNDPLPPGDHIIIGVITDPDGPGEDKIDVSIPIHVGQKTVYEPQNTRLMFTSIVLDKVAGIVTLKWNTDAVAVADAEDMGNPKKINFFWIEYTTDLTTPAANWEKIDNLGVAVGAPYVYVFDVAEWLTNKSLSEDHCFFKIYANHEVEVE